MDDLTFAKLLLQEVTKNYVGDWRKLLPENSWVRNVEISEGLAHSIESFLEDGIQTPIYENPDKDERSEAYLNQRRERGWDDSDTWNLEYETARFVLPRLQRYQEITKGYPVDDGITPEVWGSYLNDMIYAFEAYARGYWTWDGVDVDRVTRGIQLFADFYHDLWW